MTNSMPMVKLGRIARTISGVGFPHSFQGNGTGEIPFLKVSDLSLDENAQGVREAKNWVGRSTLSELGGRVSPAGSVVFPKVGAALLKNQRKVLLCEAAMDNNLMSVVPRVGDATFLMYAMTTIDMGEFSGSGPLPYVGESQVKDLWVPFPKVEEQRLIAGFLDAEVGYLDKMLENSRKVSQLLVDKRAGEVHREVTGGNFASESRESGLGWAPKIPHDWDVVPLKYVADLGSGHTPSRTRPEYWKDCTIPWISLFDVGRMRNPRQETISETTQLISEAGMENSSARLHAAGTVVLSRTASVGFSTVMGQDMAVSQHFVTWTCGERLDPYYLLYVLRSMDQYFKSVQVGTTNVTVFMPDLYSIKIPLPSIFVQSEIVDKIRSRVSWIDALADSVKRKIDLLEERKRALITAAVTGQMDITTARGADLS